MTKETGKRKQVAKGKGIPRLVRGHGLLAKWRTAHLQSPMSTAEAVDARWRTDRTRRYSVRGETTERISAAPKKETCCLAHYNSNKRHKWNGL